MPQRIAAFLVRGTEYGVFGAACGFAGQATANSLFALRPPLETEDEEEVCSKP